MLADVAYLSVRFDWEVMILPVGQGIEVAADVGDELLGELAAGVELGEVADDAAPEELVAARGRVAVEGVLEGGEGAGEVAAEALPLLGWREVGCGAGSGGASAGGG